MPVALEAVRPPAAAATVEHAAIVIGAGLSGLTAAAKLEQHYGISPLVLEAQDAVGGRIRDLCLGNGAAVELGANWFAGSQPLIAEQLDALGLQTVPTYDQGLHLMYWRGRRRAFKGAIPPIGLLPAVEVGLALAKLERLALSIDPAAPWLHSDADRLDRSDFGSWIERNVRTASARAFLILVAEIIFGAPPHMLSLLYVLFYARSSGSLTSLISVRNGHQEFRIQGGPGRLVAALAARLNRPVLTGTPVDRVDSSGGGVSVFSSGRCFRARHVVLALAPMMANRIRFEPMLSPARDRLLQSMPQGRVVKVALLYKHPWWRLRGLSGQMMSDAAPLTYTIDNSPDNGMGSLAGFVCTSHADRFCDLPPAVQRDELEAAIRRGFGADAPPAEHIHVEDWAANSWIRGSYGGYCPPGVLTKYGSSLRAGTPWLSWAGAETATTHVCQMEGAIQSGSRAADETAAALAERRSIGTR